MRAAAPILLILLLVAGFDAFCLIDLARAQAGQVRSLPKWAWAVVICASNPWGGLFYLVYGRLRGPAAGRLNLAPQTTGDPARVAAAWHGEVSPAAIEIDRLAKRFGATTALDGLSFAVRPGHVTGFLGPNGAGKTTTMRIALGLVAPTSGTALIGGRRYQDIVRPLRQVGALLDAGEVHSGRTGRQHLLSIARSNGIGRRRVDEVLQLTGLDAVAHRPAGDRFVDANARKDVLVRSPQASDLVRLLVAQGATVRPAGDGGLAVTGMGAPAIADLAAGQRIAVHELTPRHASLEDAYLGLTSASTDYRAGTATPGTAPPGTAPPGTAPPGADRTGAARTGAGS